jgi:hypothetical protein
MGATLPAWPEYFDIATLARSTCLSESMIRKLVQDPLDPLPSFLVGRSRRFYKPAVDISMGRCMATHRGSGRRARADSDLGEEG